jgi:hypothetical protein
LGSLAHASQRASRRKVPISRDVMVNRHCGRPMGVIP